MKYFTENDLVSQEALRAALENKLEPHITEHTNEQQLLDATYRSDIGPFLTQFEISTKEPHEAAKAKQAPLMELATKQSEHQQRLVTDYARRIAKKIDGIWKKFEKEQAKIKQRFEQETVMEQAVFDAQVRDIKAAHDAAQTALAERIQALCDPISEEYQELAEFIDHKQQPSEETH